MRHTREQEFIRKHNNAYGRILGQERRKRKLSLAELSSGIMSRTGLDNLEKGRAQWPKLAGDTLMLRMGIPAEYFESLASGEDLERWRLREDICLLVPGRPEEATAKINDYRNRYQKREPLEEQFLLKAEAFLMLLRQCAPDRNEAGTEQTPGQKDYGRDHTPQITGDEREDTGRQKPWRQDPAEADADALLDTAMRAVRCTVRIGWEKDLGALCLSPGELEAVLLVSAALFRKGLEAKSQELWQAVWDYPEKHRWNDRVKALILPQAAILGIRQAAETECAAADMAAKGREALEALRRNSCHCYVLPLLDCLCRFDAAIFEDPEYPEMLRRFRQGFQEAYEWFDYPGYRIWQGISVDNARDAGITLKMLRTFHGKSRKSAVYDGSRQVVTPRQLAKIEEGIHKPSYENYNKLAKQYGKYGGWHMPLLETDSIEVLEQRQLIITLLEYHNCQQAEWELQKFRKMADPSFPKVQQELLFLDAILKWKKDDAVVESLEMMLEALRCTVPDFEGRDIKWWVFQREEIMIANDIGELLYNLGDFKSSQKWYESLLFSMEQLSRRTGICSYGHDLVSLGYSNFLGTVDTVDDLYKALEICREGIRKNLPVNKIDCIQHLFYHIAWNSHAIAEKKPEEYEALRPIWQKAFKISQIMDEFMLDSNMAEFLLARVKKYLS